MSVSEKDIEIAIRYFRGVLSVGEILAIYELRAAGIKEPEKVLGELIRKGIIERGEGCYNLIRKKSFEQ
ncbi:hypothetical protein HS7_05970 [Sulfolobales archaeon HS-7]|nr:hypothetical protein HS7_05970 [Sulfolobales archaeon HS-7]